MLSLSTRCRNSSSLQSAGADSGITCFAVLMAFVLVGVFFLDLRGRLIWLRSSAEKPNRS